MTKNILIALAALCLFVAPAHAASVNSKTVGYSFIDQRTGVKISVDALTPRLAARLKPDVYVVQINGGKPRFARLSEDGFTLPQTGNVFADAGVFSGSVGVTAVAAGSSGNLTCSQVGSIVTCDLVGGPTVSGTLTAAGLNDTGLTASACVGSDGSQNLVSNTNCAKSVSHTAPITDSGTASAPNIGCTTCVTTAGGQSIAGTTTINTLTLTNPLAIAQGGTGSTTAAIAATAPITQSGTFPNQTIACATCLTTAGGQTVAGATTTSETFGSSAGITTIFLGGLTSGGSATTPGTILQSTDSTNCLTANTGNYILTVENDAATPVAEFEVTCAGKGTFNGAVTAGSTLTAQGTISTNTGNVTDSAAAGVIQATGNGGLVKETPTINSTNLITEALPVYSVSAGGVASAPAGTLHAIMGTCTFASATTCDTSSQAGGAVWAGAAVFASTSYSCFQDNNSTAGAITIVRSTTKIVMTAANSNSQVIGYICWGV